MRIWSLHPKYLDRQGLLAVWREALLAQKVLKGDTKGYRHHPQLMRFHLCPDPVAAIATYLVSIADEADTRGYNFNRSKIDSRCMAGKIPVTSGQIHFEWEHLKTKLLQRDPLWYKQAIIKVIPDTHPLFKLVSGEIEKWEKYQ